MENQKDIITKQLSHSFGTTSPKSLRNSITKVYFEYLNANHDMLPSNFSEINSDFQSLIEFFEGLDEVGVSFQE